MKTRPEKVAGPSRRFGASEDDNKSSRKLSSRRRHDDDDDDDDEDIRKPKKRSSDDDDDNDIHKPKVGWKAFEKSQEESAASRPLAKDFYLTEDLDVAIIQTCSDPIMVDTHSVQIGGFWQSLVCQHANQRYCLMCRDGIKTAERVGIKVLDHRGEWDSEKKKFKRGTPPIEKAWLMNGSTAETLKDYCDKKGLDPSNCVLEVSRSGSGKKTVYTFAIARDEDDEKMTPIKYKSVLPDLEEIFAPLTDGALNKKGYKGGN